jgi:hypothetical protein
VRQRESIEHLETGVGPNLNTSLSKNSRNDEEVYRNIRRGAEAPGEWRTGRRQIMDEEEPIWY